MDERIDLTENRDFRSTNNSRIIDAFINSVLIDTINNDIQLQLKKSYMESKKEIIAEAGNIEIRPIQDDYTFTCLRCGRKVIHKEYDVCEHCDLILKHSEIYDNLFKEKELRSIF